MKKNVVILNMNKSRRVDIRKRTVGADVDDVCWTVTKLSRLQHSITMCHTNRNNANVIVKSPPSPRARP